MEHQSDLPPSRARFAGPADGRPARDGAARRDGRTDLRYERTERHLMAAFREALAERPLERVSVTGLAKAAEINKATFYLHYRDVYDLANAYARNAAREMAARMDEAGVSLERPRAFVAWLADDFLDGRQVGMAIGRNHLMHVFAAGLVEELRMRIENSGNVSDDVRKDIVVSFVVEGLLGLMPRFADGHRDELVEAAGDLLEAILEDGRRRNGEGPSARTGVE